MTSHARFSQDDTQALFLETLRTRYEGEGFIFTAHPDRAQLPDFLGKYIPDAVARKSGRNVAIQVKRRRDLSTEYSLSDIRRLFVGHPDWSFHVAFMGDDRWQSLTIPAADPELVLAGTREVNSLIAQGHFRAAYAMAWSLLEAAQRASKGAPTSSPRTPGTVVQSLAMDGLIEPDIEKRLYQQVQLRNRVVHGDLNAQPAAADVEFILAAIEEALSANQP